MPFAICSLVFVAALFPRLAWSNAVAAAVLIQVWSRTDRVLRTRTLPRLLVLPASSWHLDTVEFNRTLYGLATPYGPWRVARSETPLDLPGARAARRRDPAASVILWWGRRLRNGDLFPLGPCCT